MEAQSAKGVRDFSPQEKILRDKVIFKLKKKFEVYGFSPLETPIIERLEILTAKFAAGADSDASKEIFKFKDQGERNLGLRFDLTVPLARYVAQNPNIKLPFKRYEIGRVYRDGPIKLGRYREFYQCDVDTVGVDGIEAEAELILLSLDAFKKLGLNAYIEVNDRSILHAILDYCHVPKTKQEEAIIIIDKLKKIGSKEVEKELKACEIKDADKIIEILTDKNRINEIADTKNIDKLLSLLPKEKVIFTPSLARGLAYYTGIVFEGFLKDSEITSSICGGGRYDKMIGLYGDKDLPAVGISFGIEPITEYLKTKEKSEIKTLTKVYVIPIKTFEESSKITQKLRENNINTEIDLLGKGISKNLDYASKQGIPYVIFIGDKEIEKGIVKIKDMKSGEEKELNIEKVIDFLKEI